MTLLMQGSSVMPHHLTNDQARDSGLRRDTLSDLGIQLFLLRERKVQQLAFGRWMLLRRRLLACQWRYRSPVCGVFDELVQPLQPRCLHFGAHYPPTGGFSVRRGPGLEEFPRRFVLPEHSFVRLIQLVTPLLVCVDT